MYIWYIVYVKMNAYQNPCTHAYNTVSGDSVCPEGFCPAAQAGRHFCHGGPFVLHQTKHHSFAYGSTNFYLYAPAIYHRLSSSAPLTWLW